MDAWTKGKLKKTHKLETAPCSILFLLIYMKKKNSGFHLACFKTWFILEESVLCFGVWKFTVFSV